MHYDIHYSGVIESRIGIEVQPRLHDDAARGIVADLVRKEVGTGEFVANAANITRQDQEGTAFSINAAAYGGYRQPAQLAHFIGRLMDPCGLHEIEYRAARTHR